jgi:hypothetical protein
MSEPNTLHPTREQWLNAFVDASRPVFSALGYSVPRNLRVSVGFPSSGRKGKAIGECWSSVCSADGTFEIFIHPTQDAPARVCDVLTHEVCHAVVGLEAGHGKAFKQCATSLGLGGKMTATIATDAWHSWADPILECLGPMPHAALDTRVGGKPKQSTRMLKAQCECGLTFRVSRAYAFRCTTCPDPDCGGDVTVSGGDTEE